MKVKASVLDYRVPFSEWPKVIEQAYDYAHMTHRPIVIFVNLKE